MRWSTQLDAEPYLTFFVLDAEGNLERQVRFAAKSSRLVHRLNWRVAQVSRLSGEIVTGEEVLTDMNLDRTKDQALNTILHLLEFLEI